MKEKKKKNRKRCDETLEEKEITEEEIENKAVAILADGGRNKNKNYLFRFEYFRFQFYNSSAISKSKIKKIM